jgi:SAM-dependent methyltransferase
VRGGVPPGVVTERTRAASAALTAIYGLPGAGDRPVPAGGAQTGLSVERARPGRDGTRDAMRPIAVPQPRSGRVPRAETIAPAAAAAPTEGSAVSFDIAFPAVNAGVDQDGECCELTLDGEKRRIRFHDYDEIYRVPGLYEHLFYEVLDCRSPQTVCDLLAEQLAAGGHDPAEQSVLDLGAGNGMVGACLADLGCGTIVGVDILVEAAEAAERDRPGVYDDYVVADLTAPTPEVRERLERHRFGVMTSVAALGFGDIPPEAFGYAYSLLAPGGWLAFCLKEDFLADREPSGFSALIRGLIDRGELELFARRRYRHRFSASGEELHYVALLGRKQGG